MKTLTIQLTSKMFFFSSVVYIDDRNHHVYFYFAKHCQITLSM